MGLNIVREKIVIIIMTAIIFARDNHSLKYGAKAANIGPLPYDYWDISLLQRHHIYFISRFLIHRRPNDQHSTLCSVPFQK
jgi:hypothetical protein